MTTPCEHSYVCVTVHKMVRGNQRFQDGIAKKGSFGRWNFTSYGRVEVICHWCQETWSGQIDDLKRPEWMNQYIDRSPDVIKYRKEKEAKEQTV